MYVLYIKVNIVLLAITIRKDVDTIDEEELKEYFESLHKLRKLGEKKLNEDIKNKLKDRYKFLFPKEKVYYINKMFLVLESFFPLR